MRVLSPHSCHRSSARGFQGFPRNNSDIQWPHPPDRTVGFLLRNDSGPLQMLCLHYGEKSQGTERDLPGWGERSPKGHTGLALQPQTCALLMAAGESRVSRGKSESARRRRAETPSSDGRRVNRQQSRLTSSAWGSPSSASVAFPPDPPPSEAQPVSCGCVLGSRLRQLSSPAAKRPFIITLACKIPHTAAAQYFQEYAFTGNRTDCKCCKVICHDSYTNLSSRKIYNIFWRPQQDSEGCWGGSRLDPLQAGAEHFSEESSGRARPPRLSDDCRRKNEKWDEIAYLDLFFVLYRKEEWQKECGILVLQMNDESGCVGCRERKECDLYPPIEEDLSYCVAPPRGPVVPNVPFAPPADITIKRASSESDSDTEKSESIKRTPLAERTRQGRKGQKGPQLIAPLREAVGPQRERILIKVPFSPGDLDKNESPSAFLERLKDTAQKFTNLDVEDQSGKLQLALLFLRQSQEDIRKKLQKLEGEDTRNLDKMLESGVPGKSKAAQPVKVELKEGARPVRVKQYPLKLEARRGVAPLIKQFLVQGILQECESEYNTPIFPVKKPNSKYRLVQDLRAINEIVKDIHPVVANPYTLLTSVSEEFKWFSVIDLKDAFFCIPLAVESRKYFAFEWESPDSGRKRQLTWTRLPQGFKLSPTIFRNQLAKELEEWKITQVTISPSLYVVLQYVDDIFLATKERDMCVELTIKLLNMLGQAGYKVSKEKAQLIKNSVIYLGCEITQGQRRLGVNRIEAICAIPLPRNHQELRSFLGMVRWCRLWIMNFSLLAKPLYEALKQHRLEWTTQQKKAFQELKQALKEAPALGLPDLTKEFQLYVNERQKLALRVLTQKVGSWKRPVRYFSKQLDLVSSGWPSCLRALTATIILIQEARKLTLEAKMKVFVPHMVMAVLEQKGGHWLSSSRMLQYQAILREQDDIEIKTTNHVNPAEFLRSDQEAEGLVHDCVEVIEQVYASRPDLKDEPLEDPEWELYTDGSSFVENGTRYAGYAVVTSDQVIEAKALLPGTSAQKAEVIRLTRALYLSKDKRVNIWTDSKYAFGVVHVHGALWKERGLLNSQGTNIKHREEVLQLLDAVHSPKAVAVMHVRGHQNAEGEVYRGNRFADVTARQVAREV
ncbi:uncharacterized protein LOC141730427 [Zonotrichia albicollis]|uniref:uncharacterized protein LOC141730427 n=1 Tax=Zonotrichia albicollis TaxID=44394 RepID=UPI003D80B938